MTRAVFLPILCREKLLSWTVTSLWTHRTSVPAKDTSVVSFSVFMFLNQYKRQNIAVAVVCTYDTRYDSTPTSCSGCVFSVPEAVCVFGERGVLRPGQTLVEHGDDGLCHSRQCSRSLDPASGFHLLRTSSMNCSTHCLPVKATQTHFCTQKS